MLHGVQAGGYGQFQVPTTSYPVLASASLLSPASLTSAPTANMSSPHAYHSMVTALDSRALVLGGLVSAGVGITNAPNPRLGSTSTTLIEAFNPFTRTWSVAGNMVTIRSAHVSVVLGNGQVPALYVLLDRLIPSMHPLLHATQASTSW